MDTLFAHLSPELQVLNLAMRHVSRNGGRLDFRVGGSLSNQGVPDLGVSDLDVSEHSTISSRSSVQNSVDIPNYNAHQLMFLAAKHRLRPILLEYDRHVGFLSATDRTRLEAYQMVQVRHSELQIHALRVVTEELAREGIELIPMKGNLLVQELYRNEQLREVGDIDLLLKREDVVQAVTVLKRIGYTLRSDEYPHAVRHQDELVRKIVESPYQSELPLSNGSLSLDVHWGIAQPYYGIPLNTDQVFERAEIRSLFGTKTLMPGLIDTIWMTVVHHGGKEYWKSFRHVLELDLFDQKMAWEGPETRKIMEERFAQSGLTNTLTLGRELISELLDDREALSSKQRKRVLRHLIPIWEADMVNHARSTWLHEIFMRGISRPSVRMQLRFIPDVVRAKIDTGKLMSYPESFGPKELLNYSIKLGRI